MHMIDVLDKLNDIGKRFFNEESSFMMAFSDKMFQLLKEVDNFSDNDKQKLISVIQRFLRTPSFLVTVLAFPFLAATQGFVKSSSNAC